MAQVTSGLVLVKCDSPTLPPEHLQQAICLLDQREVTLGPCAVGGYYAIEMRQPYPDLFRGIAWGTAWVVAQTLTAARDLGLQAAILPIRYDVDTAEDHQRLVQELAAAPERAPVTWTFQERSGVTSALVPPQSDFR